VNWVTAARRVSGGLVEEEQRDRVARRRWPWFVALTLCLVMALTALWLDRADAVVSAPRSSAPILLAASPEADEACVTDLPKGCTVTKKGKRMNRKFRDGDLGRADGFRPGKVFKAPKAARRVAVRRIARTLKAVKAASSSPEQARAAAGGYKLRARGIWRSMVDDAPCVSTEAASGYPAIPERCWPDERPKMSRQDVADLLAVSACSGAVVLTVAAPSGPGLKFFGALTSVMSCTATMLTIGREA
jgi:hypothetical protein